MKTKIYPYGPSTSCKKLSQLLAVPRLKLTHSLFTPSPRIGRHLVVNWGNSHEPTWNNHVQWVNAPHHVALASNKLKSFKAFWENQVAIPEWTEDKTIAQEWTTEGDRVYCRTLLNGCGGAGIVIGTNTENVVDAPLYTKNVKAKYEYRIHVMNNKVIDIQQKKKREGFQGGISGIRNFVNGWVFCREEVVAPEVVKDQALKAVQALGLDFGAVDVGYRTIDDKAFVYEVNTAPGIEGSTLTNYVRAFKENYNV